MQADKQGLHVRSNRDIKHMGARKYIFLNRWFWRLNPRSAARFREAGGGPVTRGTRQDKTPTGRASEPARAYDRSQTDRMAHTSSRRPPLSVAPVGHFPIQQVLTRVRSVPATPPLRHSGTPPLWLNDPSAQRCSAPHVAGARSPQNIKRNIKPSVCRHRRRSIPAMCSTSDDDIYLVVILASPLEQVLNLN